MEAVAQLSVEHEAAAPALVWRKATAYSRELRFSFNTVHWCRGELLALWEMS